MLKYTLRLINVPKELYNWLVVVIKENNCRLELVNFKSGNYQIKISSSFAENLKFVEYLCKKELEINKNFQKFLDKCLVTKE